MFAVGDVIALWSTEAGKRKYHLCLSLDGHYVFLNSPKNKVYPSDFVVPCKEFPFLPATPSGNSIISCSFIMKKADADLRACGAKKLGEAKRELLSDLAKFVAANPVLTPDEKEAFLNAVGDWV